MKDLKSSETYMLQCFDLAIKGKGNVSPNPLVGCVIVKDEKVIGTGYHSALGQNHAEVNAIESVKNSTDLIGSELYVNLEPCVHHGKTPPCCDRIIESGIKKVVIAGSDPNKMVYGRGIDKLRKAGISVVTDVLSDKENFLNRRFRTFHKFKRPYVILKWAQSKDGFMDIERQNGEKGSVAISSIESRTLVHKWRSEEDAIMVGTNTVLVDDPSLNVRLTEGVNPLRVIIDRHLKIQSSSKVIDDGQPTVVYTENQASSVGNVEYVQLQASEDLIPEVLADLYKREIQSIIVEGGQMLLNSYLKSGLWDEARVFSSPHSFNKGLSSPILDQIPSETKAIGPDRLEIFFKES